MFFGVLFPIGMWVTPRGSSGGLQSYTGCPSPDAMNSISDETAWKVIPGSYRYILIGICMGKTNTLL